MAFTLERPRGHMWQGQAYVMTVMGAFCGLLGDRLAGTGAPLVWGLGAGSLRT